MAFDSPRDLQLAGVLGARAVRVEHGRAGLRGLDEDAIRSLFYSRGMDVRTEIRISDIERDAMSRRLASAFAEGRLSVDELEDRLVVTLEATTASELAVVAADLPRPPPPRPAAPPQFRPRPPLGLLDIQVLLVAPIIAVALLVAINSGTYIWPAWMWIACAAPIIAWIVLPATGSR